MNPSSYLRVLSQLPVTKRFISGIHAISLIGASCMATVIGWPPDKGHIFACLSQPPENTVVPSSFQVEHNTLHFFKKKRKVNQDNDYFHCRFSDSERIWMSYALQLYRLVMRYWSLGGTANNSPTMHYLPTSYLQNTTNRNEERTKEMRSKHENRKSSLVNKKSKNNSTNLIIPWSSDQVIGLRAKTKARNWITGRLSHLELYFQVISTQGTLFFFFF